MTPTLSLVIILFTLFIIAGIFLVSNIFIIYIIIRITMKLDYVRIHMSELESTTETMCNNMIYSQNTQQDQNKIGFTK